MATRKSQQARSTDGERVVLADLAVAIGIISRWRAAPLYKMDSGSRDHAMIKSARGELALLVRGLKSTAEMICESAAQHDEIMPANLTAFELTLLFEAFGMVDVGDPRQAAAFMLGTLLSDMQVRLHRVGRVEMDRFRRQLAKHHGRRGPAVKMAKADKRAEQIVSRIAALVERGRTPADAKRDTADFVDLSISQVNRLIKRAPRRCA